MDDDKSTERRGWPLPNDEAKGIECPDCGSTYSTVYRVTKFPKMTKRLRECYHCGRRYSTTERRPT